MSSNQSDHDTKNQIYGLNLQDFGIIDDFWITVSKESFVCDYSKSTAVKGDLEVEIIFIMPSMKISSPTKYSLLLIVTWEDHVIIVLAWKLPTDSNSIFFTSYLIIFLQIQKYLILHKANCKSNLRRNTIKEIHVGLQSRQGNIIFYTMTYKYGFTYQRLWIKCAPIKWWWLISQ